VWSQTPLGTGYKHCTAFLQSEDSDLQNSSNLKDLDERLQISNVAAEHHSRDQQGWHELLTLTLHRRDNISTLKGKDVFYSVHGHFHGALAHTKHGIYVRDAIDEVERENKWFSKVLVPGFLFTLKNEPPKEVYFIWIICLDLPHYKLKLRNMKTFNSF
jgi:hypothetical protein